MKTLQTTDGSSLMEAVRELLPLVAASADQIEAERKLPQPLVEALAAAGMFKMLVPKSMGGREIDPITYCRIVEELSRVDGSTGWCVLHSSLDGTEAACMREDVAWEIFGKEANACWAGSHVPAKNPSQRPPDRAVVVDGGYRVTGRWSFASGCTHATWFAAFVNVFDGDEARLDEAGKPEVRMAYLPISDCQIIDNWHVSGLCGTGSHDVVVSDKFVAQEYAMPRNSELTLRHPGLLYAFSAGVKPSGGTNTPWEGTAPIAVAALCLGIARGALDALCELAAAKTPRGGTGKLISNPIFHDQIGRAEATLRAARAYLYETTREIWQGVAENGPCTPAEYSQLSLASVHAATLAAEVVDMVWRAAGASAIFTANPFERRFRDIHAITQHIVVRPDQYAASGREILGVE